jgi:hypothetical protein
MGIVPSVVVTRRSLLVAGALPGHPRTLTPLPALRVQVCGERSPPGLACHQPPRCNQRRRSRFDIFERWSSPWAASRPPPGGVRGDGPVVVAGRANRVKVAWARLCQPTAVAHGLEADARYPVTVNDAARISL